MKQLGQNLELNFSHPFTLERPNGKHVHFQLAPLPLGFQKTLRSRGINPPTPPIKITRDSTGKPMRDQTGQVLTIADSNSSDFHKEYELYHQRVAVLACIEALRNDDSIAFDTSSPSDDSSSETVWTQFADSIFDEFEQAGFTPGDLVVLCDEICRISNLLDQQVREAQANFSSSLGNRSS